jgi:hypothetical protein
MTLSDSSCDRNVEIAADQRAEQQQHRRSRRQAKAQIGLPQRPKHQHGDEQDEEDADENGEKAGRQRQVVEMAHMHWHTSKILAKHINSMSPRQE